MTRKKGVVSESTSDHRTVLGEDFTARMNLDTLMLNYQELQKEVKGKRRKLRAMKKKKMKITAEVRFLRKRYEYLVKGKSQMKAVHPKTLLNQADQVRDLSHNESIPNGISLFSSIPLRNKGGLEPAPKRTAAMVLESSQEGFQSSASFPNRAPLFDLNETVGEDELQVNVDMGGDGSRMSSPSELKLVLCRNAGEASSSSSRVGKRKISWHDPVAVRV